MKTHNNLQRSGRCQLIHKGGHPEKYLYMLSSNVMVDEEEEGGGGIYMKYRVQPAYALILI